MKLTIAHALIPLLLTVLPVCGGAMAQDTNRLGLFYDEDASVHEVEVSPNSSHVLYLVLLNPVNENYDGGSIRDVQYVVAFECGIEHPSGDILLDLAFPAEGFNLGSIDNIVAGYATAVPVSSRGTVVLATLNVLTAGNSPEGYRLVPASPASHPHTMAYVDFEDPDDNIVDMAPASGSYERPVFTFGDYTVDETADWGKVKALFR